MAHSGLEGGALQHTQVRVPCDASADDDGGCDPKLLAREIDGLDSRNALELVNGQGVAIDTAATERGVTLPNATHVGREGPMHLRDCRLGQ